MSENQIEYREWNPKTPEIPANPPGYPYILLSPKELILDYLPEFNPGDLTPYYNYNPLILKVKKTHPDSVLPKKSFETDAGFDVVAVSEGEIHDTYIQYNTGLKFEIPPNFHLEMRSRSSISKTDLMLITGTSTIDQGFSGELIIRFKIIPYFEYEYGSRMLKHREPIIYHKGDRIAQLILQRDEYVMIQEVDELHKTERAENGWGSTGK